MHGRWLTRRREAQIVAFLLLFFLARLAFGECERNFQAELHYNCSLVTAANPAARQWTETRDGSACVTLNDDWNSFDRKSVLTIRAENLQITDDGADSTHAGDYVVGLQLTRARQNPAAPGAESAVYETKAIAFVAKAVPDPTSAAKMNLETVTKKELFLQKSDGDLQDIAISDPEDKVHLYCSFSVQ